MKASEFLDVPRRWGKQYFSKNGSYCLWGALKHCKRPTSEFLKLAANLDPEAMSRDYEDKLSVALHIVSRWNDLKSTTFEMVKAKLIELEL